MKLKDSALVKAVNLPTLMMGMSTVFGSTAASAARGNDEWLPMVLCLFFAVTFQAAANLVHRYFDNRYMIGENEADGVYKEFSRQEFSVALKSAMMIMFVLSSMAGLALLAVCGWWVLIIAAVLMIMIYLVNCRPFRFDGIPLFTFITFLVFGPIGTIGASLCQSQLHASEPFSWYDLQPACAMSIIIGLMAVNCHLVYNYASYSHDLGVNRRTFTVIYGRKVNVKLFFMLGIAWAVAGEYSAFVDGLQLWWVYSIVPVVTLCVNCYIARCLWHEPSSSKLKRLELLALLNMLFCAFVSMVILGVVGLDNPSAKTYF